MIKYKTCVICNEVFSNKRKSGGLLGDKQFSKQRYCSSRCFPNQYWLGKKNNQHSIFQKRWIAENGHPLKGKRMSKESKIKMSNTRLAGFKDGHIYSWNKGKHYSLNEKAYNWKGDLVGYHGLHHWVESRLGSPKKCSNCGIDSAKKYEWASLNHLYKRELKNWVRLCTKCHRNYDYGNINLK